MDDKVLDAARRIAARFKSCLGKPIPCKEDCQCVREAEKTIGYVKAHREPEAYLADNRVPFKAGTQEAPQGQPVTYNPGAMGIIKAHPAELTTGPALPTQVESNWVFSFIAIGIDQGISVERMLYLLGPDKIEGVYKMAKESK